MFSIGFIKRIFRAKPKPSQSPFPARKPNYEHPALAGLPEALKVYLKNPVNLRCPAYQEGYPGQVSGVVLMEAYQSFLTDKIHIQIGLTDAEYRELLLPVIHNFAEFVHLLPASEHHHHSIPGGLMRHGLEVACFSLEIMLTSTAFDTEQTPGERSRRLRCWYVAGVIAGLMHDIGKPVTDMSVISFEGDITWNPDVCTLCEWSIQHNIGRYFIRWRENRHGKHQKVSVSYLRQIVPAKTLQWISEGGRDIYEAMIEAINGEGEHKLSKTVLRADTASVSNDRKKNGASAEPAAITGAPTSRVAVDSMRRLISEGRWQVNVSGGRLWMTTTGMFIAWNLAAEEIISLMKETNIGGFPRSPDTLLGVLGAAELFERTPEGDLLWYVAPHLLHKNGKGPALRCVKLLNSELLFPAHPTPPAVSVSLGKEGEQVHFLTPNDQLSQAPVTSSQAPASAKQPTGKTKTKQKTSAPNQAAEPDPSGPFLKSAIAEHQAQPDEEDDDLPAEELSLEDMLLDLSRPIEPEVEEQKADEATTNTQTVSATPPAPQPQIEPAPPQPEAAVNAAVEEKAPETQPFKITMADIMGKPKPAESTPAKAKQRKEQPQAERIAPVQNAEKVEKPTPVVHTPVKLSIPDAILQKLNPREESILQQHPLLAEKFIRELEQANPVREVRLKVFIPFGQWLTGQDVPALISASWLWTDFTTPETPTTRTINSKEGFVLNKDLSNLWVRFHNLPIDIPHLDRVPAEKLLEINDLARLALEEADYMGGTTPQFQLSSKQLSALSSRIGTDESLIEEAIMTIRDAVKISRDRKIYIRALPEEIKG